MVPNVACRCVWRDIGAGKSVVVTRLQPCDDPITTVMSSERIRRFCPRCGHPQLFEKTEVHHGLHLFPFDHYGRIVAGELDFRHRGPSAASLEVPALRMVVGRVPLVEGGTRSRKRWSRAALKSSAAQSRQAVGPFPEGRCFSRTSSVPFFQVIIDLVEGAADEVDAEAAGLDQVERAALEPGRVALGAGRASESAPPSRFPRRSGR